MAEERKFICGGDLERAIGKACDGLFYPSETDVEIIPFFGGWIVERSQKKILEQLGLKEAKIEVKKFSDFFYRLTKIQTWFNDVETKNAERFMNLQRILGENLKDLTVLRSGRIQIDIYVVGFDADGRLAGISTKAVET